MATVTASSDNYSSSNEHVINSPPPVNRISQSNHISVDTTTAEDSLSSASDTTGNSTHLASRKSPPKKRAVTKLLKEALGSLDALIENNQAAIEIDNASNHHDNNSNNNNNNRPTKNITNNIPSVSSSPGANSANNRSNIKSYRDGYTRTTACWESRYVASHTEREYRRVQDEKLKSNIKVAWVSPKSKKKSDKNDRNSNENTPNSSIILNSSFRSTISSANHAANNSNTPLSNKRLSTHEHNVLSTTLKSPRSSSSNHDIVTSTKIVNQSWGHKWGLRGASPTPRLDANTVYTTHDAPISSPENSYNKNHSSMAFSPAFANRINGEKTSADIFVKDSKVNDHTKIWIEKRREMVKREVLVKEEQKKLDAAFGFRDLANHNSNMSTYVTQLPARLDYNSEFDVTRIRERAKELKDRRRAAIAALKVAQETKQHEEKFADNEIELETLVHSLPKEFRNAVTKSILARRRFIHDNHISNNRNFALRVSDHYYDTNESNFDGKPPWSIPVSPVKSPMVQNKIGGKKKKKRNLCKKKKTKQSNLNTNSSESVPFVFQPEAAFQKHVEKQTRAREYKQAADSVFNTGKTWTKSPTKAKPFNLSTSKRVNAIRIKNQHAFKKRQMSLLAGANSTKKISTSKKTSRIHKSKKQIRQSSTSNKSAKNTGNTVNVVAKGKKKNKLKKRKMVKKKKQKSMLLPTAVVIDTPVKSAASELLSMK